MLRFISITLSALGLLGVSLDLSNNFTSGIKLFVWLVDLYRGIVYPVVDKVFAEFLPTNWEPPSKGIVDLFFVVFFMRNIVLSFFLRDVLAANGAPPNAFFYRKFMGLYIDNFLERIWFPPVLTAFYWAQAYILNAIGIPISFLEMLFLWGIASWLKGMATGRFNTLPRWFLYPYTQYRVKFTHLKSAPSIFTTYHLWLLYIILPVIFWLNERADTTLPLVERTVGAVSALARDASSTGKHLRPVAGR